MFKVWGVLFQLQHKFTSFADHYWQRIYIPIKKSTKNATLRNGYVARIFNTTLVYWNVEKGR